MMPWSWRTVSIVSATAAYSLSEFEDTELKVLTEVKERFGKYTSSMISEFSHKEKGYEETQNGEFISYAKYARDLQI